MRGGEIGGWDLSELWVFWWFVTWVRLVFCHLFTMCCLCCALDEDMLWRYGVRCGGWWNGQGRVYEERYLMGMVGYIDGGIWGQEFGVSLDFERVVC